MSHFKRAAVAAIAFILFASALPAAALARSDEIIIYPFDMLLGDADGNGVVNINDVTEIQRVIAKLIYAPPADVPVEWYDDILDSDRNGEVDIRDATRIQYYIAGLAPENISVGAPLYNRAQRLLHNAGDALPGDLTVFDPTPAVVSDFISSPNPDINLFYTGKSADRPIPLTLSLPENTTKIYLIDTAAKTCRSDEVTSGKYDVSGLIPGRTYRFLAADDGNRLLKQGSVMANGQVRLIDGGGNTFNIRDIGGWKCDGGTLRYGVIYRGCVLNGTAYGVVLTEAQKRYFVEALGIRDEIDLRSNAEVSGPDGIFGTGDDVTSTALDESVGYVRYDVAPYSVGINPDNRYQTNEYSKLLKRIAADCEAGLPSYIHCLVGADRTGTVCALVEALCGVERSDIELDYELTSFARSNLRSRSGSSWKSLMAQLDKMEGETLRDKATAYALAAGVTMDEINAIRAALTEKSD